MTLNANILDKLIKSAGDRLRGEWLLTGGVLLPALGVDLRATADVDLWGLGPQEAAQQLDLMELAESLGLPVDSINQAGAFFLKKVGFSRQDLIVLHRGATCTIYRPSLSLYWKLKIQRLSETDLEDCIHYLSFCRKAEDKIDSSVLRDTVQAAFLSAPSTERRARLSQLKGVI